MSYRQRERERHKLKIKYFDYLHYTATRVDPYVKEFLRSHFKLYPLAAEMFLSKYRFGNPQLRPALVRLAYELVGGNDWEKIIPVCAAIEVEETAYYCLDDFFDQEPTSKKDRDRLILQAVGFYSIAHDMTRAIRHCLSDEYFWRILEEMSNLDANTLQAGIIDSVMHGTDEQFYMGKVEGYNFWEQALKIGGLLRESANPNIELLGKIGKKIGMAHILSNDCWDFGKDLEDFRQGKSTLPIIFALNNASGQDREALTALLGRKDLSAQEIDVVRSIMVRCGAIEQGRKKALELCADAIELLHQFPDSEARQLIEFSTTYTQRNKYYKLLNRYKQQSP